MTLATLSLASFLAWMFPFSIGAAVAILALLTLNGPRRVGFGMIFVVAALVLASLLVGCGSSRATAAPAPQCVGFAVDSFAVQIGGRNAGRCACIEGKWWFVGPLGEKTPGGPDWCPLPEKATVPVPVSL